MKFPKKRRKARWLRSYRCSRLCFSSRIVVIIHRFFRIACVSATMLASPEKEKLTLLRRSLDHGFIDRAQYEQQLAALQAGGLGGEHVEASKRKKGNSVINDYTGLWKIAKVGYPENPLKLHSKDVVHGENRGEWAWNQKGTKSYQLW